MLFTFDVTLSFFSFFITIEKPQFPKGDAFHYFAPLISSSQIDRPQLAFSSFICDYEPIAIGLPNGISFFVFMKGDVRITHMITICDVYYSPSFNVNLLSMSRLINSNDYMLSFTKSYAFIFDKVMSKTNMVKGLYYLKHTLQDSYNFFARAITSSIWYQRPRHTSSSRMTFILKNLVSDTTENHFNFHYSTCHFAKQKRTTFSLVASRASSPFEPIHMNVWGSFSTTIYDEKKYFLTLVDDFTRFTWVYLLQLKSECFAYFAKFHAKVCTKFDYNIKNIRSNNGGEFFSTNMEDFFYTTSQVVLILHNKMVLQRENQHILNGARALQMQSNLTLNSGVSPFCMHCILSIDSHLSDLQFLPISSFV